MSDAAYRPIPIVWFAAAILIQAVVIFIVFLALMAKPGLFTLLLSALASGMIAKWTWDRGMQHAGAIWKTATALVMIGNMVFVLLAVMPRL